VCVCVCVCELCEYNVVCPWVSMWTRVYERVRTRDPGYETLTGI